MTEFTGYSGAAFSKKSMLIIKTNVSPDQLKSLNFYIFMQHVLLKNSIVLWLICLVMFGTFKQKTLLPLILITCRSVGNIYFK